MSFAYPWLLLLLVVPPLLFFVRSRRRRVMAVAAPWPELPRRSGSRSWRVRARALLPLTRFLVLLLLVVALARPRSGEREVEITSEGLDIVIALDISGSMKAEDFQPRNRLHVAKETARDFIAGRKADRIGLVVFASNSFTQCPLTTDQDVLQNLLAEIDFGDVKDGTAIGMGIANAVNRLKDVPGKSRVVILLTDGQNNAGSIDPITAAELAHSMRVKVYTVGVGTRGEAPYPVNDPVFGERTVMVPVDIDEETLQRVAEITGGEYFRATDTQSLVEIYRRIDGLEKTKVETREWIHYSEFGSYLAIPALLLLLVEAVLGGTVLRRLP